MLCSVRCQSWLFSPLKNRIGKTGFTIPSTKIPNDKMNTVSRSKYCINDPVCFPNNTIFGPNPSTVKKYWSERTYAELQRVDRSAVIPRWDRGFNRQHIESRFKTESWDSATERGAHKKNRGRKESVKAKKKTRNNNKIMTYIIHNPYRPFAAIP